MSVNCSKINRTISKLDLSKEQSLWDVLIYKANCTKEKPLNKEKVEMVVTTLEMVLGSSLIIGIIGCLIGSLIVWVCAEPKIIEVETIDNRRATIGNRNLVRSTSFIIYPREIFEPRPTMSAVEV